MKGKKIAVLAALGAGLYWILKRNKPTAAESKEPPDEVVEEPEENIDPYISIVNPEVGRNLVGGTVTTIEWTTNIEGRIDVYRHMNSDNDPYWVWVGNAFGSNAVEFYTPSSPGEKISFMLGYYNSGTGKWDVTTSITNIDIV